MAAAVHVFVVCCCMQRQRFADLQDHYAVQDAPASRPGCGAREECRLFLLQGPIRLVPAIRCALDVLNAQRLQELLATNLVSHAAIA